MLDLFGFEAVRDERFNVQLPARHPIENSLLLAPLRRAVTNIGIHRHAPLQRTADGNPSQVSVGQQLGKVPVDSDAR